MTDTPSGDMPKCCGDVGDAGVRTVPHFKHFAPAARHALQAFSQGDPAIFGFVFHTLQAIPPSDSRQPRSAPSRSRARDR